MKISRKFLVLLCCAVLAFVALALPLRAADWETDYAKALKTAKESNKMVLMDFTGSDWCSWCMKLDKEVFTQSEFQTYAQQNLVLLKVDFPEKTKLPAETAKQNDALAKQYNIEGYPTIVVLNPSGKNVGKLGYMKGGPSKFIGALKALPKS